MDSSDITVQKIDSDDAGLLHSLLHTVFSEMDNLGWHSRAAVEKFKSTYSIEYLKRTLSSGKTIAYGAQQGSHLAGAVWGYTSVVDGMFYIDWAVVDKMHRRNKLMTRLLQALECNLGDQGIYKSFLYVSRSNYPAINCYITLGYRLEGIHPNHFFGDDFISLGKVITYA